MLCYLPSAFGVFVVTLLKMLTSTRNSVIRRAIRPGITSGGTTKLIHETTTNRPKLVSLLWEKIRHTMFRFHINTTDIILFGICCIDIAAADHYHLPR